ncbi:MAG TPA: PD-(D/E)XK nuclease domain-containing protein [Candidatus Enterocloster excrementipullorum]|uniref:PD-(D/E)XK nuclease domain-containing protein n=1 Tax=Candidatus Enterocloster excrementipullorum TaxID=2838559 RepID=A0A9D2SHP7_9FIRM|nr:PD-(D/E)XK nuclease domain-containing protein [Candidatus Enterocloster excrementipullorum]
MHGPDFVYVYGKCGRRRRDAEEILGYKDGWLLKSNKESGNGYSDIFIRIEDKKIGIIIEVKYAEEGQLEAVAELVKIAQLQPVRRVAGSDQKIVFIPQGGQLGQNALVIVVKWDNVQRIAGKFPVYLIPEIHKGFAGI